MTVRIGKPEDLDNLYDLLLLMHAESGLFPLSPEKTRATLSRMLNREVPCICGVIENPGGSGLVGAIGLVRSSFWYSESHHFEDVFTFVHPDHRKGHDYAGHLLDFVKAFGDRVGEPVFPGVLSNKKTLGKIRLYSRRLPLIGAIFVYPPTLAPEGMEDLKPSERKVGKFNIPEHRMGKALADKAA